MKSFYTVKGTLDKIERQPIEWQNIQGNANHNELSPYIRQNSYYLKDKRWQVLRRMWRKRNPCTLLVGTLKFRDLTLEVEEQKEHFFYSFQAIFLRKSQMCIGVFSHTINIRT